jgi:hypothetical protein
MRAEVVKSILLDKGISEGQIISVEGFGKSKSPYYNSAIDKLIVSQGRYIDPELETYINDDIKIDYNGYPEGRFYLRTVVIEIENTVK